MVGKVVDMKMISYAQGADALNIFRQNLQILWRPRNEEPIILDICSDPDELTIAWSYGDASKKNIEGRGFYFVIASQLPGTSREQIDQRFNISLEWKSYINFTISEAVPHLKGCAPHGISPGLIVVGSIGR
jgi:hypothetical protein